MSMNLDLLPGSDPNQLYMILSGLEKLNALRHDSHIAQIALIAAFLSFVWMLYLIVQQRGQGLGHALLFLIFFPTLLALGLGQDVPVVVGGGGQAQADVLAAQQRVRELQATIEAAKTPKQSADAQAELQTAADDLRAARTLQAASGVTTAPPLLASLWNIGAGVASAVSWVMAKATSVSVADRKVQIGMVEFLKKTPGLSSAEVAALDQAMRCLDARDRFANGVNNAKKEAEGVDQMMGGRQPAQLGTGAQQTESTMFEAARAVTLVKMQEVCGGLEASTAAAIDASISREEIQAYTTKWFGMRSISRNDQVAFLANEVGLPASSLVGKSDEEIVKTAIRYRHLQAMNHDYIQQLMTDAGGATGGGVKAWAGDKLAQFVVPFAQAAAGYIQDGIAWAWFFLIIGWPVAVLAALFKGMHMSAPLSFLYALCWLCCAQISINLVHQQTAEILKPQAIERPSTGFQDQFGRVLSGTVDKVFTVDAAAAMLGFGGAYAKVTPGMREKIAGFFSKGKSLPTAAVAGVLYGGNAANDTMDQLNAGQQEFAKLLGDETSTDPFVKGFLADAVGAQANIAGGMRARAEAMEAILVIMFPLITSFVFFMGFGKVQRVGAAAGESIAHMSQSIGHQIGGLGLGKALGRGAARIPKGPPV